MPVQGPVERALSSRPKGPARLAALIDPDNFSEEQAALVATEAQEAGADCIFVGGSTIGDQAHLDDVVYHIKKRVTNPVILFPGNVTGISRHADAILFSSLLNSTNTYFIIGAQAIGAAQVRRHKLEAIPMGYLVFGDESTTSFVGQVRPIPVTKPEIADMYALAAQYLGMRALYLEAGSGANEALPLELVRHVRACFEGLLIVGGGITSPEIAAGLSRAGANLLVMGNLLEKPGFKAKLSAIAKAVNAKP